MKGCPVKDKFEGIWKEELVTLSWYCPEMCLTKLQEKQCPNSDSNLEPFEYEAIMLHLL